jgi:hypothetical protein
MSGRPLKNPLFQNLRCPAKSICLLFFSVSGPPWCKGLASAPLRSKIDQKYQPVDAIVDEM